MTTSQKNLMISELTQQLGDCHFFTVQDLQRIGLFRTMHAARKALKNGEIAYIRISPRRRLISRTILLEFIRKNICDGNLKQNGLKLSKLN